MAVIENSVQINRSPEDVFDYLVDLRHELEWNPDAQSMEKLSDGPIGVGTRYLAKWKQSSLIEVECIRFNRPRGWAYSNGGPVSVVFDVTLTPQESGTLLASRFEAQPNGLMKLFFPVFLQVLKRGEKQNMRCIKAALEQTGASHADAASGGAS